MDIFAENLKSALEGGQVACLQIRLKELENSALIQAGRTITEICHAANVEVILNDRPDLVTEIGADGAHIGQEDMDYFSSREVLGGDAILGVTCHNSKELAFAAAKAGADYVAFGAFFDTPTKTPKAKAEVEILKWWHEAVEIPCVAIGGITVDNAQTIIAAGADFIAVSSGVWTHPDGPAAAVSQFSQLCAQHSPPLA